MLSAFSSHKFLGSMSQCKRKHWLSPLGKCILSDTFLRSMTITFQRKQLCSLLWHNLVYFVPLHCNVRSFCTKANISNFFLQAFYLPITISELVHSLSRKENHTFENNNQNKTLCLPMETYIEHY